MNVDGVVNADVSFENAAALVTVRAGRVSGDDLTRAVQGAGFEANVIEDGSGDTSGAGRAGVEQP